jgi:hypothetical protein
MTIVLFFPFPPLDGYSLPAFVSQLYLDLIWNRSGKSLFINRAERATMKRNSFLLVETAAILSAAMIVTSIFLQVLVQALP